MNVEKILVGYPPIESNRGIPLLSQNRQFQWFNSPTYIYPVIPSLAATLLKKKGYNVIFHDGIALREDLVTWLEFVTTFAPDLIFFEVKTPVIQYYWDVVDSLKTKFPKTLIVLAGDHVTALPYETFENSKADYVLTGGDFDILLHNLVEYLNGNEEELAQGIYSREGSKVKKSGDFVLDYNLDNLPFIDRELTNWKAYAYDNGNYKRLPGTYIMSGRDCWHHKCTFCSWTTLFGNFRTRSPKNVVDEIEMLYKTYGIREVMDDTGCFPVGKWLHEFCDEMIARGLNKKVNIDCNMRFGALSFDEYKHMRSAGFRFMLFGLESANQETLDRIVKGLKVEDILPSCRDAKRAGLSPHITVMFGYPWEGETDVRKTIQLAKTLMVKGYAHTMQSTIVIPYPGTPLFKECDEQGILLTKDWSQYDMRSIIMKGKLSNDEIKLLVKELYNVSFHPLFLLHRILGIRDLDDVKYYARAFKKVFFGHLKDFS